MITATDEQVIDVMRAVVAEVGPGFVYERPAPSDTYGDVCMYVHTDDAGNPRPGCIVGHVLHRLGVPLDVLASHEKNGAMGMINALQARHVISMTETVRCMLHNMQSDSDDGRPWGAIVSENIEAYHRIKSGDVRF